MSVYLTYHKTSRPTGRRLGRALAIRKRGIEIPESYDLLLRWGNASQRELDVPEKVVNSAAAIWLAGDKLASLEKFVVVGLLCPIFSREPIDDTHSLGRSRRGFGGRDIKTRDESGYEYSEFFTLYIPNSREYRLHVVKSEVIRVQRKYLEYPERKRSEYIKNHSNGYVFDMPARRLNRSRLNAAVRAVEALGLDFGAVDLVVGEDGLEYVLEVNTAPACSPLTLTAYKEAFQRNFPQIAELSSG